jgi:exodeoxyribonuclease VII large subunit
MHIQPNTLTVSQLNRQVKVFLEQEIGLIHVEGELSNLSKPSSGHYYFTLKDTGAQLRCVYFKNRHSSPLSNPLADGQKIVATGRLSLYEARGDYQLIVEHIAEAGIGALYQQFIALKNKLSAEGLFSSDIKKSLPTMPETIGIITSPKGAALQDILSTLARRFPIARIIIYPSEVQGVTAPQQLIKALQLANTHKQCDVLLLARGGGSLEDLWAFNHEQLAREIAKSIIPVISGVGHETDLTIADLVADFRAETPTAAAIAATPDSVELLNKIDGLTMRLFNVLTQNIHSLTLKVGHLSDKIASPRHAISAFWQKLDYLEKQLTASLGHHIQQNKQALNFSTVRLYRCTPKLRIQNTQVMLNQLSQSCNQLMRQQLTKANTRFSTCCATLHGVSPLATLSRGYAIASHHKQVLLQSQSLKVGDCVDIRLARGGFNCKVISTYEHI